MNIPILLVRGLLCARAARTLKLTGRSIMTDSGLNWGLIGGPAGKNKTHLIDFKWVLYFKWRWMHLQLTSLQYKFPDTRKNTGKSH
jgi:hypothetical protein